MNFETAKTFKGEFVVVLEETKEGGYLCVLPFGEQLILAPTELDDETFSEYSKDDLRITLKQRQALKEYFRSGETEAA